MKEIPKGKLKREICGGDGKRAYLVHTANDGWEDFRIYVDTDDVDHAYVNRMIRELIRRWNSFEK